MHSPKRRRFFKVLPYNQKYSNILLLGLCDAKRVGNTALDEVIQIDSLQDGSGPLLRSISLEISIQRYNMTYSILLLLGASWHS